MSVSRSISSTVLIGGLLLVHANVVRADANFVTESGNHFKASINNEAGYIDNFLYQKDNEQSTSYLEISPALSLQAQAERHLLQLEANASYTKYQDFDEDDHSTFKLKPQYRYKAGDNKTIYFSLDYVQEFEFRGTGLSTGKGESLEQGDETEDVKIQAGFLYGSTDSVAQLGIGVSHEKFEYDTRRDITQVLDWQADAVRIDFSYLLSGKSYLAFDLGYTETDYENSPTLNQDVVSFLAGWKWQSSGITQLKAQLGYQELSFERDSKASDNNMKWLVEFKWAPSEISQINFTSTRNFEKTNRLVDSYRVVDNAKVEFNNSFTETLSSHIQLSYQQEEIVFQGNKQEEDYFSAKAQLNYQRSERLTIFAGVELKKLDSEVPTLEYQRSNIMFGFNVKM